MIFDGTITLGTILEISTMISAFVVAWMKLSTKLTAFAVNLNHHAEAIEKHTTRLDAIDGRLIAVIADLQRLIGRSEVFTSASRKEGT